MASPARRGKRAKPAPAEPVRAIVTGPGERIEARGTEAVRVVKEFPPGTILRPRTTPARVQVIPKRPVITCPFCESTKVSRRGSWKGKTYYQCGRCVDETTGDFTAFGIPRA